MNDMTVIPRPNPAVNTGARALSLDDLVEREGEVRVRDIEIAGRLGFGRSRDIRHIIERNIKELTTYGRVCDAVSQTSAAGGRPGKEYWLNEGQALVICALSRTPKAAAIRKQIIDVFMAYRAGRLEPAALAETDVPETLGILGDPPRDVGELGGTLVAIGIILSGLQRQMTDFGRRIDAPRETAPSGTVPKAEPTATVPPPAAPNRKGKGKQAPASGPDLLYGMPAIAAYLQLRKGQAYHLAEKGGMPTFRFGRIVCATRASIDAWVAASATLAGGRS